MLYDINYIILKSKIKNMASQEEKRNRFKKLAVYRTNEVLKRLKVLSNCANRSAYEYSEEEVNKIFSEIETHLSSQEYIDFLKNKIPSHIQ